MSDLDIPDYYRRGDDLIARINELALARNIDPERQDCEHTGNGWIYLLLACRRELLEARK